MKTHLSPIRLIFFALLLAGLSVSARAQESETASSSTPITLGEFAIRFANQLGYTAGISHPLTELEAANLLAEEGITPFGGWVVTEPLTSEDLARMIVQSLKALDEIDDAEEDNPATTAYKDYLKRVYNVEINELDPLDASMVGKTDEPSAAGQFADSVSTDPLKGRGAEGEIDELTAGGKSSGLPSFVSEAEVTRLFAVLTPVQGGGDTGQVDSTTADTTPSGPSPQ